MALLALVQRPDGPRLKTYFQFVGSASRGSERLVEEQQLEQPLTMMGGVRDFRHVLRLWELAISSCGGEPKATADPGCSYYDPL